VIKSEVYDVYVDAFIESRDVTFFESIFPIKNLHSMYRLPKNIIGDATPESSENSMQAEHTFELVHKEIDSEAPKEQETNDCKLKRQMTAKSLGDDFTVYLVDDTHKTILETFTSSNTDD
jgi:hypothetical protein